MVERIIARYAPKRVGGGIDLFFPDAPANLGRIVYFAGEPGMIAYFAGAHGEASLDYYRSCKPVKGEDGAEAIARYVRYAQSIDPEYQGIQAFRR